MTAEAVRFCISAALALSAVVVLARVALQIGFVAYPNPLIVSHRAPVPYLGGLAIFLATVATLALSQTLLSGNGALAWRPLLAAIPLLCVGTLDDYKAFAPLPKLGLQIASAGVGAVAYFPAASPGWFLAAIWVVAIVNAVNFLDVSDGFAGGILMVSLLGFALLGYGSQQTVVAVAGACAGFLVFNRPPARIYLGDGGSHFLGGVAAFVALAPPLAKDAVEASII
jgi:UDP-GlcNAc:undecaprenyl-phosphate GlcNAc-1-phosphate transferase